MSSNGLINFPMASVLTWVKISEVLTFSTKPRVVGKVTIILPGSWPEMVAVPHINRLCLMELE